MVMPNPATFVTVTQPVGIAVAHDHLLYTQYCTEEGAPAIFSVTDTGTVTVFAPTFPSKPGCIERYLDVNPGLGPWAGKQDFVYVTQGTDIFEITPDGAIVAPFATLPPSPGVTSHTGITFDREGTFGHDLIITDTQGNVFRISPSPTPTPQLITNVDTSIENPAVVPVGFGPHGGKVWVAAEGIGDIIAVSPAAPPTRLNLNIRAAENVSVIPATPSEFGASGGAYFAADHPQRIIMYPASDFVGLAGNVLVGQEISSGQGEIKLISAVAGGYTVSTFDPHPFMGGAEGAAFVSAAVPTRQIYAAKFLCGEFKGTGEGGGLEGPVQPASYATAINVHNPNARPVTFTKKAVLLFDDSKPQREAEEPRPPGRLVRAQLGPDWGLEIDCDDIRKVLLRDVPGPAAPTFIKGWVVLHSPLPLDVVAVYTAHTPAGFSITTERVPASSI
jgi:hypothetical protein